MIRKLFKFWLPVALWVILIFLLSNLAIPSGTKVVWQDFLMKKAAHLWEYAVLYIFSYRAFKNTGSFSFKTNCLLSFLLVLLYASSDEYHQTFISGRNGTIQDIFIDLFGALASFLWLWKFLPKTQGKLLTWAKNWQLI